MKRIFLLIFFGVLLLPVKTSALEVSAKSALLMDGDTGQVLYEKNADEKSLIASTTKIMTAFVTLEEADLSEVVVIPPEAVGIEGSSMYLRAGEELTVEQLLYGMMLVSGNDAAVALALHVGGGIEEFANLMNRKAEELHLRNSHFANPNGLDSEENYASARDLGHLAAAALQNEDFRRIVSTRAFRCGDRYLTNHNKLLWQYDGAMGVKTGFTKRAGRILVGSAERNGRRLISVTISDPSDWSDHSAMLDYGFSMYQDSTVVEQGQTLGTVPVMSGERDSVPVTAGEPITCYLLPGEEKTVQLNLPAFLYAPVEAGARLGTGEVYIGAMYIGEVPLLAGGEVSRLEQPKRNRWMRAA
ncbi:MAG: D-alanyl-D-alanine carboxypeptidase [Oscillospiraceae bacterium]|nr:D-alanyl-D-alanine carboxypeptidase [Oscillospiraceae bacterium]